MAPPRGINHGNRRLEGIPVRLVVGGGGHGVDVAAHEFRLHIITAAGLHTGCDATLQRLHS